MGKKRLSPPAAPRYFRPAKWTEAQSNMTATGDVRFWTPPVFEKNFLFSVNEHGENRSIWVKTERGDCQ